jgi:adenylate kinase
MGRNFILLGPPGSGKGTQAAMLAGSLNLLHISTGEILRGEIAKGSKLGREAAVYMDKGNLVPDDVVFEIVEKVLGTNHKAGAVLDGFPRTKRQAEMIDEHEIAIEKVIYISVPDEEIVRRLSKRHYCEKCNKVVTYDDEFCLVCSSPMTVRADDKPDVIRKRLQVYHELTEPLITFYKEQGCLAKVNGVGTVAEINRRMMAVLGTSDENKGGGSDNA